MILWIHCLCLLFYTDIIINKLINSSFKKKFPLTSSDVDPHWDYADPDPAFFSMRIQAKKVHVKKILPTFLLFFFIHINNKLLLFKVGTFDSYRIKWINICKFKNLNKLWKFYSHYFPLFFNPGSEFRRQFKYGSMRIRIHNIADVCKNVCFFSLKRIFLEPEPA